MSKSKVMSADDAVKLIKNGQVMGTTGAGNLMIPETILSALERRFLKTGQPKNLTLFHCTGFGNIRNAGLSHFGPEGLVKRVIGGHYGNSPRMADLVVKNKIEAYCLPQGVMDQLIRAAACGYPRVISHVGLGTFIDPRQDGGRLNQRTQGELVELVRIDGREYLSYKVVPLEVAIIRGTTADEDGNITMEYEPITLEVMSLAQAAKNRGGLVIAQVKRLAARGSLDPKLVKVPGILVDKIVVDQDQQQIYEVEDYNPVFSGEIRSPEVYSLVKGHKTEAKREKERMYIVRRAALELEPGAIINLGYGISQLLPRVVVQERIQDDITFTIEQGTIGGIPLTGMSGAAQVNPQAIIDRCYQFEFYQGGGLDIGFLSFGQLDREGNVNVSKLGPTVQGVGGFVDISQNAKKLVLCGLFTGSGTSLEVTEDRVRILKEGKYCKFKRQVDQISFSGEFALRRRQRVLYVTERAVFELQQNGLVLTEVAPGVDIEKDLLSHMEFKPPIAKNLKTIDMRVFGKGLLGIRKEWQVG